MSDGYLDTDVIVRFIAGDDQAKERRAAELFRRLEGGDLSLDAPDTVIADAVHVLTSPRLYALPRREVADLLSGIVSLPGLRVDNSQRVLRALSIVGSNLDFGDGMLVASMEASGPSVVYSFDRDFNRFPGVTRLEP